MYNDKVTSDTTSNYFLNTNNGSIAYSDNKIVITNLNNNIVYLDLRSLAETVKGKTVSFQCDVEPNNCEVRLEIYAYSGISAQTDYTSTATTLTIEDFAMPLDSSTGFFRIVQKEGTTGSSFAFKNFTVWISG